MFDKTCIAPYAWEGDQNGQKDGDDWIRFALRLGRPSALRPHRGLIHSLGRSNPIHIKISPPKDRGTDFW